LEDVYKKSFLEGGLTKDQLFTLFDHLKVREYEQIKFQAACAGIDLEKEMKKQKGEKKGVFGDPTQYDKLSAEERQKLTDSMMSIHRKTFKDTK